MTKVIEVLFFFIAIGSIGALYSLPKEVFPYSPPGYYEVYEQDWDGRSNPVVSTGEYEFSEGGYSDVLYKNIISSILLCYIAYKIGRMSVWGSIDNYTSALLFWHYSVGGLILYNLGWICRTWHLPYIKIISIILFICSAFALVISLFVNKEAAPHQSPCTPTF